MALFQPHPEGGVVFCGASQQVSTTTPPSVDQPETPKTPVQKARRTVATKKAKPKDASV